MKQLIETEASQGSAWRMKMPGWGRRGELQKAHSSATETISKLKVQEQELLRLRLDYERVSQGEDRPGPRHCPLPDLPEGAAAAREQKAEEELARLKRAASGAPPRGRSWRRSWRACGGP